MVSAMEQRFMWLARDCAGRAEVALAPQAWMGKVVGKAGPT